MSIRRSSLVAVVLGAVAVPSMAFAITSGVAFKGWTMTFPDPPVGLIDDQPDNGGLLSLEKVATFSPGDTSFTINFSRANGNSAPDSVNIEDEFLTNGTGTNWTSFQLRLTSANDDVKFTNATLTDLTSDPFTTVTLTENNTVLTFSGGTVPGDGGPFSLFRPGSPDGTIFILAPDTATSFQLAETPNAVPEPAALGMLGAPLALLLRRRR